MKTQTAVALAAAFLLSGATTALAANYPAETIRLSSAQQKIAWSDMHTQAPNQKAGSFVPEIGAILPTGVKLKPVPQKAVSKIPSLKPYDFAMVKHQLVIVNPANKVIAFALKK